MLSILRQKSKFSAEEYEDCLEKQPEYLSNASPVPQDPSDYCKDPCRWHSDMTIKPWEGMSAALVKSHYNISYEEEHRNEIIVLLNKWRESSVFAQTELVTFLQKEMEKGLDWSLHHKAGTLDIRIRKDAYVDEKTADEVIAPLLVTVSYRTLFGIFLTPIHSSPPYTHPSSPLILPTHQVLLSHTPA